MGEMMRSGMGGATFYHVRLAHPAELGAIVDDSLTLAHKFVELDCAVIVDETDTGKGRLGAFGPDAHHLTV